MAGVYEYRTIKIAPGRQVSEAVRTSASSAIRGAGGYVYGLWAGLIGAGSDEAVLMTYWPDQESLAQAGARTLGSIDGVVESHFARLVPAIRPVEPTPPEERGVYAFRWFGLPTQNWAQHLELGERDIWPWVDAHAGCRVVGYWRNIDVSAPDARALVVTSYPDMSSWDRTRLESAAPPAGADGGLYRAARAANQKRAQLTDWTVMRILTLIPFS